MRSAAVLGLYTLVSTLVFGWSLWPHPGRRILGLGDQFDPEIFVWSFAWWPHAVLHWTNPFVTHAIYQPVGASTLWTTTTPGLAVAFAPLTLLVGPVASFNLCALLLPALAAWTAFLLCRRLSGSTWASIVGGFIFGFSSYVVAHQFAGHLHTTAVFLLPLVALVVLRYLWDELGGWGLVLRLGPIMAFQLMISTEVALTLTLALALGLVLAFAVVPERRGRVVAAIPPVLAGYAFAALLAAPFVAYLLIHFESGRFVDTAFFDGDLLNIVVPTRLIALGGTSLASFTSYFPGNDNERDLYLGLPVLAMVGLHLVRRRRSSAARFLGAAILASWLLALGANLRIHGDRVVELPWRLVRDLPGLDNVITPRLAVYASLAAAVAVALWISSTRGWLAVVLPLLALATLVPATWHVRFAAAPQRPEFFASKLYKLCIPRDETLAIFPFGRWGDSMVWQAESGFWFKMAEGNLGRDLYPPKFVFTDPVVEKLQFQWAQGVRPTPAQLAGYVRRHHVDRVLSVEADGYPTGVQMHRFGPLQGYGGVLIAPACGYDSLTGDTRRISGQ